MLRSKEEESRTLFGERVWNTFTYNTYVLYVRFEFTGKQVVVKMNHEMDSSYLAQS